MYMLMDTLATIMQKETAKSLLVIVPHTNRSLLFELKLRGKYELKDVRAHYYCASLLLTQITCHVIHQARALSNKINK